MFRSQLFDHLQGAVLRALVLLLLLCLFASSSCLFGMWLYVVYVCACLMYLSVGCLVVSEPSIPQTSTSGTHTHTSDVLVCGMFGCFTTKHPTDKYIRRAHTQTTYSHIPNKQLDDANKQRSSNGTKHEGRPPEDGQTIVTETCRVLMMCFTNIFNNLVF